MIYADFLEIEKGKFVKTGRGYPDFVGYLDIFASIATESFYIIDVKLERLCYISPDASFLHGFNANDTLCKGYDYFRKIVYPEDFTRWEEMRKAVVHYIKECSMGKKEEIDHFSCSFSMKWDYSLHSKPLKQMTHHRMKPVWEDDELHYLLCTIGASAAIEAGNLRLHYKDGLTCEIYSFVAQRWKQTVMTPFSEQERAILMLMQQGKKDKNIAKILCIGEKTLANKKTRLFEKMNVIIAPFEVNFNDREVDKKIEAFIVASNHKMIYPQKQEMPRPEQMYAVEKSRRRTRKSITKNMLIRIQQSLDNGISIRAAARLEDISEGAIRNAINDGRLKKGCLDAYNIGESCV